MTPAARRALLGAASLLGACVYLNSLYNAQRIFDEAERATWSGRDAEAGPLYDSVVAKAARSYRQEPDGSWADDALYLLGRAHLRRGEPERAEAALRQVLEHSGDERIRAGATLHLGMAAAQRGRLSEALPLLNEALGVLQSDALQAQAYLWRGRVLLELGEVDGGGWNLDRAALYGGRYRVAAGLERLRWAVVHGERGPAAEAADRLLGLRDARVREDTLRALVGRAAERWGPEAAVELLASSGESSWPPEFKDRLLLERARFHLQTGDDSAALADARAVAGGAGEEVVEARLLMARILLLRARDVDDLAAARAALLPAVGDARVLALLESVRVVELLVEGAERADPPEALFAAAEIARDELGARELARTLLLRYAETPERVWSGKALLAALDLTSEPERRPPLLRRMARMRNNPYVAAARAFRAGSSVARAGGPPPQVRELDARLQPILTRLTEDAAERARELDVLARERSDTSRSPGTSPPGPGTRPRS